MINGEVLNDQESMTVRLAVDALANIMGEELGLKDAGLPVGDVYMAAISRVQKLLAGGPVDRSVN